MTHRTHPICTQFVQYSTLQLYNNMYYLSVNPYQSPHSLHSQRHAFTHLIINESTFHSTYRIITRQSSYPYPSTSPYFKRHITQFTSYTSFTLFYPQIASFPLPLPCSFGGLRVTCSQTSLPSTYSLNLSIDWSDASADSILIAPNLELPFGMYLLLLAAIQSSLLPPHSNRIRKDRGLALT